LIDWVELYTSELWFICW